MGAERRNIFYKIFIISMQKCETHTDHSPVSDTKGNHPHPSMSNKPSTTECNIAQLKML